MKRIIKDFKKLDPEIITLIAEQYPSGYEESQLISFVNAKGEFIKALEIKTDDIVYLIKVDRQLDKHFDEQDEDDSDFIGGDEDNMSFDESTAAEDGDDLNDE